MKNLSLLAVNLVLSLVLASQEGVEMNDALSVNTSLMRCTNGYMRCSGTGFLTCDNGNEVYRACGPGTECRPNGNYIICDYPQNPKPDLPKCLNGQKMCIGDQIAICKNGKYKEKDCEYNHKCVYDRVEGGVCRFFGPIPPPPPPKCFNGQKKCVGDKIATCRNGRYMEENCEYRHKCVYDRFKGGVCRKSGGLYPPPNPYNEPDY